MWKGVTPVSMLRVYLTLGKWEFERFLPFYSTGQYSQVILRKSKILEYLGYSRIFNSQKVAISRNSKLFFPAGKCKNNHKHPQPYSNHL